MKNVTVRRMEIRTPFPLNFREFALTDFKKSHDRKKQEKKTKRMALVPSNLIHPFGFCEVWKVIRLKTRWEKTISTQIFSPVLLETAF